MSLKFKLSSVLNVICVISLIMIGLINNHSVYALDNSVKSAEVQEYTSYTDKLESLTCKLSKYIMNNNFSPNDSILLYQFISNENINLGSKLYYFLIIMSQTEIHGNFIFYEFNTNKSFLTYMDIYKILKWYHNNKIFISEEILDKYFGTLIPIMSGEDEKRWAKKIIGTSYIFPFEAYIDSMCDELERMPIDFNRNPQHYRDSIDSVSTKRIPNIDL